MTTASAPSGNQRDKLQGMVDQTKYFEGHIDKVEELLTKHKALAGLGGKVTRPAEVISNIFGGNETDRKQFEREILGMQEIASRILTGSAGRPLAAEAAKINGIVAGLQLGDTTANTVRAYRELRPLIQKIRGDLEKRKGGGAAPDGEPAPAAPPGGKWWEKDKRTDAGVNDNVAMRGNISDGVTTGIETLDIPPGEDPKDFIRRTKRSGGGPVMSDAMDDPIRPGAQYAQMKDKTGRDIVPMPREIIENKDWDRFESIVDDYVINNNLKDGDQFVIEHPDGPRYYESLGRNSGGRKDWREIRFLPNPATSSRRSSAVG